jgi:FAD/FMN-containing dehydrogenase
MTEGLAAMKKALPECRPVPFGHVGDGNIHYNPVRALNWDAAGLRQERPHVNRIVHDIVADLGGSISAEHGVGQSRLEELERYKQSVELDLMRSLKRALDPHGIMNPGKLLVR